MCNKSLVFLFITLLFPFAIQAQESVGSETDNSSSASRKQVFEIVENRFQTWNELDLEIIEDISGRYCFTSIHRISKDQIAIIGSFESGPMIKTYRVKKNQYKPESAFPLEFLPVAFTYSKGAFFVASLDKVIILDSNGSIISEKELPQGIKSIHDIKVIDDSLSILTADGQTFLLSSTKVDKRQGWPCTRETYVIVQKKNDISFSISQHGPVKEVWNEEFVSDNSLGAMIFLGSTDEYLLFLIEQANESGFFERKVFAFRTERDIPDFTTSFTLNIPPIFFAPFRNEISVFESKIFAAIATPEGFYTFSIDVNPIEGDYENDIGKLMKTKEFNSESSLPMQINGSKK